MDTYFVESDTGRVLVRTFISEITFGVGSIVLLCGYEWEVVAIYGGDGYLNVMVA